MSLPKRDGVHGRYYLIHKPDTDPEVLEQADQCIQDVLDGTAKENHSGYPVVVRNQNGTPFLPSQLLERYLSKLPLKGFPYADAVAFCDALRRLAGWKEIDHTLGQYIEHQVQERYFEVGEKEDYFSAYPPCTVWPELRPEDVDDGLLRFACYVAVCYTVYGASYNSLTTEHILGLVSQIRPDMVKQLKTGGSGKLPKDIQRRKTEHFTASANDAFATIRITARDSTEECYGEILDYLCAVLEQEEWHNEQEKIRQLMPYKLPAKLVEYLKTGPLRLEFPDQEWVKWAELYSFMDVQEMTWKRKKLLSLMVQMDNYSDYLLLWSPRDKKLWYLDIEHEEFHPLAKWDDFIADPGRYLNGMIEGEFEE